ncbi:MAG: SGNH/GDSL hydrolase family protein [Verrucomicrobiales bacterium]|nr:SGNH/GDSL hydrolase family protein [Verrucomicrobiales bacterium]
MVRISSLPTRRSRSWPAIAAVALVLLHTLPRVHGQTPPRLDPAKPPRPASLRPGDRLAICGDSITEQRMYSRILETYLAACQPKLGIEVRQFGWSGERADGFFERMENDVLRFHPTVATTCYGMNDHRYRPFEPWIGELYRIHLDAVVRTFQSQGVRVVVGSPGSVGRVPHWVKDAGPTVDALNANLAEIRNLALGVARNRRTGFADIFTPMWNADQLARQRYGTNYAIPGKDGVHPDWPGQVIRAHAFLEGLGVDGNLGTLELNVRRGTARATAGHAVVSAGVGTATFRSERYPFCVGEGNPAEYRTIASGTQWVPFHQRFNRLKLVVHGLSSSRCEVAWGNASRTFNSAELEKGILLPAEFPTNPFSDAFRRVDEAVAAKQAFETQQIKGEFHGAAGKADMETTVQRTEAARAPLVEAIAQARVPVTHTLTVRELP